MVGAAGIEPATAGLEIRCSIRLSYAPSWLTESFYKDAFHPEHTGPLQRLKSGGGIRSKEQ